MRLGTESFFRTKENQMKMKANSTIHHVPFEKEAKLDITH